MSEHEQERFEDYLELEHYLESLRAEHKGILPPELTEEQASVYHMAALLRSATPEHGAPRASFLEDLQRTLQRAAAVPDAEPAPAFPPLPTPLPRRERPRVSRRHLLTGGAVAAASLALGTAAGVGLEKHQEAAPGSGADATWDMPLIGKGVATTWLPVLKLVDLGRDAYPFQTEGIVGYLMRSDEQENAGKDSIIALSAACTHMGCLVQWHGEQRSFNCPCHNGKFDEYGQHAKQSAVRYLRALPRLNTKVADDGYIYVEVPATPKNL